MRVWTETSRLSYILFHEFHFQLVPLNPYSVTAKTILIRSLIIHIFTRVEDQHLKQRLKQKRRTILKKTYKTCFYHSLSCRNIFSFLNFCCSFLIIIPAFFSLDTEQTKKLRGIHFMKCLNLKYFKFNVEIDEINELFSCRICFLY